MKITICLLALLATTMLSGEVNSGEPDRVSILQSSFKPGQVAQENVGSVLEAPIQEGQLVEGPILEGPIVQEPELLPYQTQRVPSPQSLAPAESVILPQPPIELPPANICRSCCAKRCCCKPVPSTANFCLIDPDGCEIKFCAKVPACCIGQEPRVEWRCGVLGRKVARLCWDCCEDDIKVVVTRRGKVRVRD